MPFIPSDHPYPTVKTGELAGSLTATQCPNIPAKLVAFRAPANNTGSVYLGAAGVTKADGTTDTTTGFALSPGEWSPWLPVDNLNRFYRICDNATDDVLYVVLR